MAYGSKEIARTALRIALTETREEENQEKRKILAQGIKVGAVDAAGIVRQSAAGAHKEFLGKGIIILAK